MKDIRKSENDHLRLNHKDEGPAELSLSPKNATAPQVQKQNKGKQRQSYALLRILAR